MLYDELPVLQLLGTKHCISADTPYTIDKDAQLVCKYLRAYTEGSPKMINRKYNENEPKKLVKFSTDPDLPKETCHRILQEHVPRHMASSKITQQLFIRYKLNFAFCIRSYL